MSKIVEETLRTEEDKYRMLVTKELINARRTEMEKNVSYHRQYWRDT